MSYPGCHKITITGPESEIEHLLVQTESKDGDRYLCVDDPKRKFYALPLGGGGAAR